MIYVTNVIYSFKIIIMILVVLTLSTFSLSSITLNESLLVEVKFTLLLVQLFAHGLRLRFDEVFSQLSSATCVELSFVIHLSESMFWAVLSANGSFLPNCQWIFLS